MAPWHQTLAPAISRAEVVVEHGQPAQARMMLGATLACCPTPGPVSQGLDAQGAGLGMLAPANEGPNPGGMSRPPPRLTTAPAAVSRCSPALWTRALLSVRVSEHAKHCYSSPMAMPPNSFAREPRICDNALPLESGKAIARYESGGVLLWLSSVAVPGYRHSISSV